MNPVSNKQTLRNNSRLVAPNNRGVSLIELIIAIGVLSIFSLGMAKMMSNMSREEKGFGEKIAQLETFQTLSQAMAQIPICTSTLTTPSQFAFDASQLPATGGIPSGQIRIDATHSLLQVGQAANPAAPSLIVKALDLVNIQNAGSPDIYHGQVQITFDSTTLVRTLHPLLVDVYFSTATTSPPNGKSIVACVSSNSGGSTPASFYEQVCNSDPNASKGDVYSVIPSGGVPCTPAACSSGDTDLGVAGCRNLGAGKYHGTYSCYRNCIVGAAVPTPGQTYNRYCGWATSPTTCTPFACAAGATKTNTACQQNGTGYSGQPIGSCTATCSY